MPGDILRNSICSYVIPIPMVYVLVSGWSIQKDGGKNIRQQCFGLRTPYLILRRYHPILQIFQIQILFFPSRISVIINPNILIELHTREDSHSGTPEIEGPYQPPTTIKALAELDLRNV